MINKKIRGAAYRIAFDEVAKRFFIVGAKGVRIFDLNTNQKIATLTNISYPNQVFILHKNNLIVIKSTVGLFYFYALNDFTFLGKIKIDNNVNTDTDFVYNEEQNMIYGIMYKKLKEYLYCISPITLKYSIFPLRAEICAGEPQDKPITRYILHKVNANYFYLIRNFYDVGKNPWIYECSYGKYYINDDEVLLKEKLFSSKQNILDLYDITYSKAAVQVREFCKGLQKEYFIRLWHNQNRLFIITSKAIYEQENNGFKEVYRGEYVADYAEFENYRYILTWDFCLIQKTI